MGNECNAIAVITARGGSKRIPRKNIRDFCGKPIIEYSIRAALDSGIFCEVMVSTDDNEIADIARKAGASVPFMRSERTSDDYATTAQVIKEVLDQYKEMGREFSYACCLYPTAPFITPELLREAMEMMETYTPDEVVGVVEFSYPPQRSYFIGNDGRMAYKYKEYVGIRSQDLEKLYHDAGQFYVYNVVPFYQREGRIVDQMMPMVLSPLFVQDIDTEEDWILAETKYQLMKKMESRK